MQEKCVYGIAYPCDGPSSHLRFFLLNGAAFVVRDDAATVKLSAQATPLQVGIELSEINRKQIVRDAVDRVNIGRLSNTASVEQRFIVAGHETRRSAPFFRRNFHSPRGEIRAEETLGGRSAVRQR